MLIGHEKCVKQNRDTIEFIALFEILKCNKSLLFLCDVFRTISLWIINIIKVTCDKEKLAVIEDFFTNII